MNTPVLSLCRAVLLAALAAVPAAFAASARSDILPAERRRGAIETALRLSRPGEIPTVAADTASPFSPPDFNVSDEPPAAAPGAAPGTPAAGPAAPSGPRMGNAREILETMTPLIPATGSIDFRGEWLLTLEGGKRFRVGDVINVGLVGGGTQYPLEITRISATDFTLRYQGELKTRPIQLKSSPK